MFCAHCGVEVELGSNYCRSCGNRRTAQPISDPNVAKPRSKIKAWEWAIGLAGCLFIAWLAYEIVVVTGPLNFLTQRVRPLGSVGGATFPLWVALVIAGVLGAISAAQSEKNQPK